MKIRLLLLLSFIIISFFFSNTNQTLIKIIDDSGDFSTINIYISVKHGSDTNGNGSFTNPFKSLCILNETLDQYRDNKLIVNLDYGDYGDKNSLKVNCTMLEIKDFTHNITFQQYSTNSSNNSNSFRSSNSSIGSRSGGSHISSSSSSSSNKNRVNIINLNLIIKNSIVNFLNLNFHNYLNYDQGEGFSATENSLVILNNVLFDYEWANNARHEVNQSRVIVFESEFIYSQNLEFLITNNGSVEFLSRSIAKNIFFHFDFEGNLSFGENCILEGAGTYILSPSIAWVFIDNSTIINPGFQQYGGSIYIVNSILQGKEGNGYGLPAMIQVSNTSVYLTNTTITSNMDDLLNAVVYMESSSLYLTNILVKNFKPLSFGFISNSGNIEVNNLTVINCQTSFLFFISFSNVNIKHINIINYYFIMFYIEYQSSISIDQLNIPCSSNYVEFLPFIQMYPNSDTISSNISISNSVLNCVGGLQFDRTVVKFFNVSIDTSFSDYFISLSQNSYLELIDCTSTSNSDNDKGYFITMTNHSTLFSSNFKISYSSSILSATDDSVAIFESASINQVETFSNNQVFNIEDSNITFILSRFANDYSTLAYLISLTRSSIFMNETTFEYTSFKNPILYGKDSSIQLISLVVQECQCEKNCFRLVNSSIDIISSYFEDNFGSSFDKSSPCSLIDLHDSTVKINSTTFQLNNFDLILMVSYTNITLFQNYIQNNTGAFFMGQDSNITIYDCIFNSNNNPPTYLFNFFYSTVIINGFYLFQNTFMQNLFYSTHSTIHITNTEISRNYITQVLYSAFPINDSLVPIKATVFYFVNCSLVFDGLSITTNSIDMDGLFYLQNSNITINSADIYQNSLIGSLNQRMFFLNDTNLLFRNSTISSNDGGKKSLGLIWSFNGSVIFDDCIIDSNLFYNGNGTFLSFDNNNNNNNKKNNGNYFKILNSKFKNNLASFGLFYFNGYSNFTDAFENPKSEFKNNTITFNRAFNQGGAIFTTNFPFTSNTLNLLSTNTIERNFSPYGLNFASYQNTIKISNFSVYSGIETTINYKVLDYYGNVYSEDNSLLIFYALHVKTNKTIQYESQVNSGIGKVIIEFSGQYMDVYTITIQNQIFNVSVSGCLPYQYYNDIGTCVFCTDGSSFSKSKNECIECDSNSLLCLDGNVYVSKGYYLIDQDIEYIEQCALEMCKSNNNCSSSLETGNLCFSCTFDDELVVSKNGIQCCSNFQPLLLIPIALFFLIYGLILSIIKYNAFTTPIGHLLIYLQLNSVLLFSFKGIYLLPLFRCSIDALDGICYFKGMNYLIKCLISFLIIISLFSIGYTDITYNLLFKYYGFKRFDDKSIPKFLKKIKKNKQNIEIYNARSRWSLFLLLLTPILFNSFSLMVFKQLVDKFYLIVDFSISYSQSIFPWYSILSLIFVILTILLIFIVIIFNIANAPSSKLKIQHFLSNLFLNSTCKGNRWWDVIIIKKSLLYCGLSISLIFNFNVFIEIVLPLELVYSTLFFLVGPIDSNRLKLSVNIINLMQSIVLIFANSSLLSSLTPYNQGLALTSLSFSIIFYFIYLFIISFKTKFTKFKKNKLIIVN